MKHIRGKKMGEKILPITISTYEAFCACMKQNVKAIYICVAVFEGHTHEIYQALEEHGYEIPGLPIRRGALFVKGINIEQCAIW